jgi:hypothetical protein
MLTSFSFNATDLTEKVPGASANRENLEAELETRCFLLSHSYLPISFFRHPSDGRAHSIVHGALPWSKKSSVSPTQRSVS